MQRKKIDQGLKKMNSQASEVGGFEHYLQCSFSTKVPIFKTGKNAKFALQHQLFLVFWSHPELKVEKKKMRFHGKWSVSGHLKDLIKSS